MTAMTGETGAGKSILVDALGLAMGDRADTGVIRHGANSAEIIIGFDLHNVSAALEWLEQQDLRDDNECIIRRVLNREGNSKGFINGRPVPMRSLKELGELLVDIHGQHQHQSLVKRDIQRQLLDDYACNQGLLTEIQTLHKNWKNSSDEYQRLHDAATDSAARIELLQFQVKELQELGLAEDDLEQLDQEHDRLANAGKLMETCQTAIAQLYEAEDNSVYNTLNKLSSDLDSLCDIDQELKNAALLVNEAMIQSREAADELHSYLDRLELDPQRLEFINDRLVTIHDLARKHRVPPTDLPGLLVQLTTDLENLDHSDEKLEQLAQYISELESAYDIKAQELSQRRQRAIDELNEKVTEIVQDLGMADAQFKIELNPYHPVKRTAEGFETIDYLVCTNPGQEFSLLSKVASGGELSRISLAIQVILAQSTRINTLVYDEVDTGIGGPTAEIVGRLLRTLGKNRQVLCVTHLPQVAAQAHNHLHVHKQAEKNNTVTGIQTLDDTARIDEIARMLGGVKLTEQSRAHAMEMLNLKE